MTIHDWIDLRRSWGWDEAALVAENRLHTWLWRDRRRRRRLARLAGQALPREPNLTVQRWIDYRRANGGDPTALDREQAALDAYLRERRNTYQRDLMRRRREATSRPRREPPPAPAPRPRRYGCPHSPSTHAQTRDPNGAVLWFCPKCKVQVPAPTQESIA